MTDAATTDAIIVEYDLTASQDKVWRALTEPELIASWLMKNDFRPEVGHRFTFQAQPLPGWDGRVQCEVLAVEPKSRLSYSWVGGSEEQRLNSVVTWTLTPKPSGGTSLLLEHTGFTQNDRFALEGMGKGWRGHVGQRLVEIANGLE